VFANCYAEGMARERDILTDEQWARLEPLLPPQKPVTGRPAKPHREVLEAILWVLRTGAPWRDLPAHDYGPWQTAANRFYRWRHAGVWDRVLATLQADADARGVLDWDLHHIDGSVVRAHQHAAGAKGGTRKPKPSDGAGAGSAPNSTSASKGVANPWCSSSVPASGTS
jgi:transposase